MRKIEQWKIDYIKNNLNKKTRQEIANELNISVGTLQTYIKKYGWYTRKNLFTDKDIDYMKTHYLDMPYKEIADHLGFTEKQIRGKINNMGLTKLRSINDNYFHKIDNPLKAYFLGFIYADGYLVFNEENRIYELGIEIQLQDKYLLEKLNNELGGQNIIYIKKGKEKIINNNICCSHDSAVLRIYSKKIVTDLMSYGIEPNKTQKDICPQIEDKYFFDWLRGYVDGDGCYYISSRQFLSVNITSASKIVLEYLQSKLYSYNIETHIYSEQKRKHRLYCFKKEEVYKLLKLLYPSTQIFCLSRKYNKIIDFISGFAV